jgi:hypothetical protein
MRKQESIKYEKDYPFAYGVDYRDAVPYFYGRFYTIGFCGKIYNCLAIENKGQVQRFYSYREVSKWFASLGKDGKPFFEGIRQYKYWRLPCERVERGFKELEDRLQKDEEYFKGKLYPVFVGYPGYSTGQGTIVVNPCLKKLDFVKKFGPEQAYQEIRMYLSNLAFPNKAIPEVSNNDMIEAKGFDLKTSFRKAKRGSCK